MNSNWIWYGVVILLVVGLLFWMVMAGKASSTGTSTGTSTTSTTTGTNFPDTGTSTGVVLPQTQTGTPYPTPTWTDTLDKGSKL